MFSLIIILILVLFVPFLSKTVERNLEVFLFLMGVATVLVSHVLDSTLLIKVLNDPLKITFAVLIAGLLFKWFQTPIEKSILGLSRKRYH